MKHRSHFETVLESGSFAVTAEIAPPKSASVKGFRRTAASLRGFVDALNVTDNQAAVVRLSSLAGSLHVMQEGVEPVLHVTCRDRNRIGLQSDLLGAYSLGVRNVLVLSGDPPEIGNHKSARPVFDLDSVELTRAIHEMHSPGRFMNGEELKYGPDFFYGVGENPSGDWSDARIARFAEKMAESPGFIQTQPVFDVQAFVRWMEIVGERGLLDKAHLLAGVLPLRSAAAAERIARVPGVVVPQTVLDRMGRTPESQQERVGLEISIEAVSALRKAGISGIHVMALNWPEVIPQLVSACDLLPRAVAADS